MFGADAAWDFSAIHGWATPGRLGYVDLKTRQNYLATTVGRAGYAFDRFLPYATAGFGFSDYSLADHFHSTTRHRAVDYPRSTRWGWTLGLGADYAVYGHWVTGLDWKYYDFGASEVASGLFTHTGLRAGPGFDFVHLSEVEQVVTARVSYKF